MKVNILVLNYNGKNLLEQCLGSIVEAAGVSRHSCTVSVIDNQSTDESVDFLKRGFEHVVVIKAPENKVLCSYNEVVRALDDDVVILLNNDIKVDVRFIDPLIRVVSEDPSAFLVTPKCLSFDGKAYEGSLTKVKISYGLFWASAQFPGYEREIERRGYTFAAGFGAFDRKKFVTLGGYDELYLPGRLEDSDICFRAWKRGWKCYYEPSSVVYHMGGASFKKEFGKKKMAFIDARNTFLFMWKNIEDKKIWIAHVFFLLPRMVYALIKRQPEFVKGFFCACQKLPQVCKKRKKEKGKGVCLSEYEIFARLSIK